MNPSLASLHALAHTATRSPWCCALRALPQSDALCLLRLLAALLRSYAGKVREGVRLEKALTEQALENSQEQGLSKILAQIREQSQASAESRSEKARTAPHAERKAPTQNTAPDLAQWLAAALYKTRSKKAAKADQFASSAAYPQNAIAPEKKPIKVQNTVEKEWITEKHAHTLFSPIRAFAQRARASQIFYQARTDTTPQSSDGAVQALGGDRVRPLPTPLTRSALVLSQMLTKHDSLQTSKNNTSANAQTETRLFTKTPTRSESPRDDARFHVQQRTVTARSALVDPLEAMDMHSFGLRDWLNARALRDRAQSQREISVAASHRIRRKRDRDPLHGRIEVAFSNTPTGTRVKTTRNRQSNLEIDVSTGYAMFTD